MPAHVACVQERLHAPFNLTLKTKTPPVVSAVFVFYENFSFFYKKHLQNLKLCVNISLVEKWRRCAADALVLSEAVQNNTNLF